MTFVKNTVYIVQIQYDKLLFVCLCSTYIVSRYKMTMYYSQKWNVSHMAIGVAQIAHVSSLNT